MSELPIGAQIAIVIALIAVSAFFSGTETALMSLNRYRLRHQAQNGNRSARLAEKLLARPDRLIGIILLGNTFANFAAAGLTTVVALRLWGDTGFAVATAVVSIATFVFGELAPKTYGAIHPERLAMPASWVYAFLVRLLYPIVWAANFPAG